MMAKLNTPEGDQTQMPLAIGGEGRWPTSVVQGTELPTPKRTLAAFGR
jgi:hypothetical protein